MGFKPQKELLTGAYGFGGPFGSDKALDLGTRRLGNLTTRNIEGSQRRRPVAVRLRAIFGARRAGV